MTDTRSALLPIDHTDLTSRRFDVCGLGEAMVEFNQTRPHSPNFQQGFGGDTSNATIAAARAGARCCYLTRLGADTFGESLQVLWQSEDVDTGGVTVAVGEDTGLYFVTHEEQGHQFSYRRAGSAASRMSPAWLDEAPVAERLRQSRWLHVSGISMAISGSACDTVLAAQTIARRNGTRVSLDANLRLKLWPLPRARACLLAALADCDLFLPSLEDMQTLSGLDDPDAIVDWCHAHGAPDVVLKLGPAGALVSTASERHRVPGQRVALVDATGAGDCFSGNLLAQLCAGYDLFTAARWANAAASLAVQGHGAVAPLPRAAQVRAVLEGTAGSA
jgi:2-dehydro-3-deoxygluconokinase